MCFYSDPNEAAAVFLRKGCVSNGATAPSLPGSGRKTHRDSSAGTFMAGEALLYVLTG